MTFDHHLCRQDSPAIPADNEVDVWSSKLPLERVSDRLDRPKIVLASGVRKETPVSLKVGITTPCVLTILMDVRAPVIDLPDLDQGIADRVAGVADHPAAHVR